ncbi:NADH-quinone oxidoreductase subunit L [Anaerosinus massiliensis]|uniref:NADH-quinone oxidoreductase subunit L n=1 Tax=Massilibacillus massiliensis TaxID=1806837 RepID=UPI000A4A7AC0|nr:NADH-quinone oxidoreductase subunit L [Massilibacillus massiliensis]
MFSQYALQHAWLIPLMPAVAFILVGVFLRRFAATSAVISIGLSFLSFVLALGVGIGIIESNITVDAPLIQKIPWVSITGFSAEMGVYLDPISAMMLFVVTLITLLVQIYSVGYMRGDDGFGRFFAYLSLFSAAMLGLVLAVNFMQLFVFWELVGLCSYLLIGYYFHKISAREAAKKAFFTTRVGDFGLLIGILLLQSLFGTLDFRELAIVVPGYAWQYGTGFLTAVAILLFLGAVGKSGQFPLHVWLPDAMEGPTPVSALIHAATMVVAGVYLIARSFFLFSILPNALEIIAWIGAFTACFAASIAITQRELKRILAYSTISQLGYMMLALGVGSVTASMFHLMTHAFFKASLFLTAGVVLHALPDKSDIFTMGGLRHKMPLAFVAMTIGVLAISGIWPFAGFFSKDEILLAASQVSMPLYSLAMLTSFMTAFYMARLLIVVFCGPEKMEHQPHAVPISMQVSIIVLSIFSVVGGYIPYVNHFGEWVRFGLSTHAAINWSIAIVSMGVSIAAICLAWLIYGTEKVSADQLIRRFRLLYKLSFHKYYIDELYLWMKRTFVDGLGRFLYWLELHFVEGIVNEIARLPVQVGDLVRKGQSGNLQRYSLVMFSALLIIIAGLVFGDPLWKLILAGGDF